MRTHTFAAKLHPTPNNSLQNKAVQQVNQPQDAQKNGQNQGGLSFMQRNVGNAAIARALGERPNMTFESTSFQGDVLLENVLNNRNNARLKVGDKGGSVQKVQEALLRDGIPLPRFGADAQYGNETAEGVKQFKSKHSLGSEQFGDVGPGTMSKLDELNKGGNGPGPQPVPPTPNNEVDPVLESRISQIVLAYIRILREQNQALVLLERDLREEEKPSQPLGNRVILFMLQKAATFVVDSLFGITGPIGIFQEVLSEYAKISGITAADDAAESGITAVFGKLKEVVNEGIEKELAGDQAERASLELFVDAQRNSLFDAKEALIDHLLNVMAPKLRTMNPGPADREQDPKTFRLFKAQDLNIAVNKGAGGASDKQYLTGIQQYAAYQAQHDLDPNAQQESNLLTKEGTNMSKMSDHNTSSSVRGILEIHVPDIEPEKGKEPTRILALHISGLSEKARKNINENHADKTIGELGFPRRMWDGHESSVIPPSVDSVELMMGRNEQGGHPVIIKSDESGRAWLTKKGDGDQREGETVAMDEVDQTRINEITGGIKEPG